MENSQTLRCVGCNKEETEEKVCECGHMIRREGLNLLSRNIRKRKAPYRPNLISSEWIGLSENIHFTCYGTSAKSPRLMPIEKDQKKTRKKRSKFAKLKATKDNQNGNGYRGMNNNGPQDTLDVDLQRKLEERKENAKKLLEIIDKSYKNIYFNRCKSYKKISITDIITFEFDFSTFEKNKPNHPSVLENINSKIKRTNNHWRTIDEN